MSHNNARSATIPVASDLVTAGTTPAKADMAVKMFKIDSLTASIFGALLGEETKKTTSLLTSTPRSGAIDGPRAFAGIIHLLIPTFDVSKVNPVIAAATAYFGATTEADKGAKFAAFGGTIITGFNPADATQKAAATAALTIFGMFAKQTDGLLYKITQYTKEFGKQAGSEGLYLYLARISELSSKDYRVSTEATKKVSTDATVIADQKE